jgi:hypothetical protein
MKRIYPLLLLISFIFINTSIKAQQAECYKVLHIDHLSFKDYNFITLENYVEDTLFLMSSKRGITGGVDTSKLNDSVIIGKCYELTLEKKDSLFNVDLSERLSKISIREIETCFKTIYRDNRILIPVYFTDQIQDLHYKKNLTSVGNACTCENDSSDFSNLNTDTTKTCELTSNITASIEQVKMNPRKFIKAYRTNGSCLYSFLDTIASLFISTYDPQYLECIDLISTVSYGNLSEDIVSICKRLYTERFIQFYGYVYDKRNMSCRSNLDQKFIGALVKEMSDPNNWTTLKISLMRQLEDNNFSDLQKHYFNHMVEVAEILKEKF